MESIRSDIRRRLCVRHGIEIVLIASVIGGVFYFVIHNL